MIMWIATISLVFVAVIGSPVPVQPQECEGLVKYNLTFEGLWSEETFPKQYPQFRPNAQWSKLVGRSHSNKYYIWHLDEVASIPLRLFAEKGDSSEFDIESQGHFQVLDAFYGPPIVQGVGSKWTTFFVDKDHSKMSFASKIVPSPDWFVGVDSLDLCDRSQGEWIEEISLNLGPMDAGSDKGFTFSSPNWQDIPLKPIYQITSKFPSHPANSFFYPELDELPPLARVTLRISQEYRDESDFILEDTTEDEEEETEEEEMAREQEDVGDGEDMHMNEKTEEIAEPNQQEPIFIEVEKFSTQTDTTLPLTTKQTVTASTTTKENSEQRTTKSKHKATTITSSSTTTTTTARPTTTMDWPFKRYRTTRKVQTSTTTEPEVTENLESINRKPEEIHNQLGMYDVINQHYEGPAICEQEEWTEWSTCSVTCGYGKITRYRNVPAMNEEGAVECVKEEEEQFCGSVRNCYKFKHFSFDNWGIN